MKTHTRKMLRSRVSSGTPAQYAVTSMAMAVLDYERGMNPGPTMGGFRIDAASGPDSKWNARAGQIFAGDFCATEYSEAAGRGFVDALSAFRILLPEISTDLAIAAGFENLESYRRFSRSFARRLRADRKVESRLSAANRLNNPRRLIQIVRKLVEDDAMSCDEEDAEGRVYTVPPPWRSVPATRWLRSLDKSPLVLYDSAPRKAFVEEFHVGSRVPKSLPVNFYDPVYLRSLDGAQYTGLDPQPAVDIGL